MCGREKRVVEGGAGGGDYAPLIERFEGTTFGTMQRPYVHNCVRQWLAPKLGRTLPGLLELDACLQKEPSK